MADGPSAEDAATDLGDGDSRLTRDRHKRQDGQSATMFSGMGQDTARRIHEDVPLLESHHHHHRQHHPHQHRPPRRNCHAYAPRRHPTNNNNNSSSTNNNNRCENGEHVEAVLDVSERVSKIESVQSGADTTTRVLLFASPMREDYEEDEEEEEEEEDDDEEEEEEEDEDRSLDGDSVSKKCRASVRVDAAKKKPTSTKSKTKTKKTEGSCNSNHNNGGSGAGAEGGASRGDNAASSSADGRRPRSMFLDDDDEDDEEDTSRKLTRLSKDNKHGKPQQQQQQQQQQQKVLRAEHGDLDAARNTDRIASDASGDGGGSSGSSDGAAAAAAVSASASGAAAGVTANGMAAVARHHQGSPFKGQVRTAEDTLVGPYGKKRCADRYDSSESSDSGVAISCGECSSSGTSDITEPGSPCSTSSDEGVAIRGASASPLPSLPKLAPSSQIGTRPQWPWTPPLAATACSTYKRLKGEPEAGAVPRSGAADPSFRGISKSSITKPNAGHHHHETQGKITEYFKTQVKPQQLKIKKSSEAMSVLVAKSSSEFRRPPTVQRNKGGLAKYLGTISPNGRNASSNDWEVRTLTMSPPPTKKTPPVIAPRTNGKMDKKLPKPVPSLPISNDVLKNIPSCKISSMRLTSSAEASPTTKTVSQQSTPTPSATTEATPLDFKGCILSKPHVNENNNLTNGCAGILGSLRSQGTQDLLSRLQAPEDTEAKATQVSPADEDDDVEEEEDSRSSESRSSESRSSESRSCESKPPLSPILSAPTTIRFPAREPEKDRQQTTDSGVCRWDKCEESFESSSGLLEHLQAAHINTQTGGDNFVCQWQGCKVQGRSSCSRRWLERHVLSHGGNKPFRCIVDGCGSRFSSQTALERHVNGHFNQPETSNNSGRRSCESGGKLVRRNGKRLRYRRQPWSARLFDYFDSGVMEGLQHRLLQMAKSRTQGRLAETPGNSMALTSQVLARRVELDGKTKVLLRWYPPDIEPDEWVLESEVRTTKNVAIRKVADANPEEVGVALYSAISGGAPPTARTKQRRKPVKNS
ncbi:AE binding protein 2 jing [Megalopta genalis]|uniref:AE binding protein 2 jing n=1 Tax=Megalopta genalis TaxID=115081 RepID=UPI003FD1628D